MATKLAMDSLQYTYNYSATGQLLHNQLNHIRDNVSGAAYAEDIDDQPLHNYRYDAIGNLLSDSAEGISSIGWTVYGKIQQITRSNGTRISYSYDAAGNRISKSVQGTDSTTQTWYVRDGSGNVMSIYVSRALNGSIGSGLRQTEVHLYGSSRLGILKRAVDVVSSYSIPSQFSVVRGNKFFELSNHLGNVLATVSDKKTGHDAGGGTIDYYEADIVSASDYAPFGMQLAGRTFNPGDYRYGFNGKENDNEVKGEGNQQDYGMRIYDSRVGKFLSVDPLTKSFPWYTPYQFAGNMPTIAIDLDGAEPLISSRTIGELKDPIQAVKGAAEITIDNTKRFLSSMGNTFLGVAGGALQPFDAGHYGNKVSKDRWAETFPMLPNNNIIKDLVVPVVMAPADLANRIRNNPFNPESWGEAAAIIALARGGSFFGKFKSTDFGLKVDLMGGEHSRYGNGYINFDKNAKSGIKADISDFKNRFGDNTISEMIVDNPQAPFLNNVTGAIQSGGTITIRGGMSNRNFNSVFNGKAPGLDAFDVISKKENIANPGYKQNDGKTSVAGEINEIILRKKQ